MKIIFCISLSYSLPRLFDRHPLILSKTAGRQDSVTSAPLEKYSPACPLGFWEVGHGCSAAGEQQMCLCSRTKAEAATGCAAVPPPLANQSHGDLGLITPVMAALQYLLLQYKAHGWPFLSHSALGCCTGHLVRRMVRWTDRASCRVEPNSSPGAGLPMQLLL